MTKTLNPTITVTVSGPTGSGKSRVLAVIADVLKLIHSDCIIEAPDVKAEKEMCGDDHTAWHKPRNGTIFKLEEINLPTNTGHCSNNENRAKEEIKNTLAMHTGRSADPVSIRARWETLLAIYMNDPDIDLAGLFAHEIVAAPIRRNLTLRA
ncbi:ABC transporter ATPase [Salmonella enterica subsp. enterica]|nr:ABC transporter ATPase [Salmonella enterica subsp. enterica]